MRLQRKLRSAGKHLLIAWYAFRHPSTPLPGKLALFAMAVYLISPVDLIPDTFPVLGWIDDAVLISFGLPALLRLLPAKVLEASRERSENRLVKILKLHKD